MEPGLAIDKHYRVVSDVIGKGDTFVNRIEDYYKELEGSPKAVTLRAAYNKFAASLMRYHDMVLKDCVTYIIQGKDKPKGVAKPAQWGNKDPWVKGKSFTGLASVAFGAGELPAYTSTVQEFVDDDITPQATGSAVAPLVPVIPADLATHATNTPPVARKKKKVVREVVVNEGDSAAGSTYNPTAIHLKVEGSLCDDIKILKYYIDDKNNRFKEDFKRVVATVVDRSTIINSGLV